MRYSANGVLRELSSEQINFYQDLGVDIINEANKRSKYVDMIPSDESSQKIDMIFGEICTDIAFSRHVGKMESVYTPLGMMYYQYGKDLSEVKVVIGTGGVLIYNHNAKNILAKTITNPQKPLELRPTQPEFMLDSEYLLSAMGLLSSYEPKVALKLMKDNIKII